MYKLIADYHTHTVYSHGKGTIQDNVEVARRKGLKKVAITDHGFGHIGYGISRKKLTQIRTQINRLNDKYGDIEILLGIEANLVGINGQVDLLEKDLKYFDIILMGFHKGAKPHSVKDGFSLFLKNFLSPIYPAGREKQRQLNTQAMIKAINRYPVNIISHPGAKIDIDTRELAKAAAKRGVALEINASHGFLTVDYVKIALEEKAPLVINSDAHRPDDVGEFSKGIDIANRAGVKPEHLVNSREYTVLNQGWR